MKKVFLVVAAFAVIGFLGCGGSRVYDFRCGESIKSKKISSKYFTAICPANCTAGWVWGTGFYTADSSLCAAAIHAGVIDKNGGQFKVTVVKGKYSYTGTMKNGIKTSSYGRYPKSFVLSK